MPNLDQIPSLNSIFTKFDYQSKKAIITCRHKLINYVKPDIDWQKHIDQIQTSPATQSQPGGVALNTIMLYTNHHL